MELVRLVALPRTPIREHRTRTRKLFFASFIDTDPEFIQFEPNLDAMLEHCDAAILIGDPALLALEDRDARLARTGERLEYLDLAHVWKQHTGVPWVSAVWAVRPQAIDAAKLTAGQVTEDFLASRDHGRAHIEDLVREWSPRIAVPAATIRSYLTEHIHYVLDDACLDGMDLFFRYAAETGVLPPGAAAALARVKWLWLAVRGHIWRRRCDRHLTSEENL